MKLKYDEQTKWIERAKRYAVLYNQGKSMREISSVSPLTQSDHMRANRLGFIVARTLSEAGKLALEKYGPNRPNDEANKRLSIIQSTNNRGGRSKWFTVAGKKVQGTWEQKFAMFLEERKIEWERCKPWKYTIKDKEKHYTPDFFLPELNLFIEIKGYWWGNDKEKMIEVQKQHKDKNILIIEDLDFEKYSLG
jgi:hypothetical protein